MPSATSPVDAGRPHVPAWRRLGLKLKNTTDTSHSDPVPAQLEVTVDTHQTIEDKKRKHEDQAKDVGPRKKKSKKSLAVNGQSSSATTATQSPITLALKRQKSVTFTPETKIDDGDSIKQLFSQWVAEQKAVDSSFVPAASPAFKTPVPPKVSETFDPALEENERRVKRVEQHQKQEVKKQKVKKPKVKSPKPAKVQRTESKVLDPALFYLTEFHESKHILRRNLLEIKCVLK